jgi:hypothetical protein
MDDAREDGTRGAAGQAPAGPTAGGEPVTTADPGDLALIDDLLARSPEERLAYLEQTLRSLEALLAATGSTAATE